MKKIVGVLGSLTVDDENDKVIALYNNYNHAIIKNGGIPFVITPYKNFDYWNTKISDMPILTKEEENYYKNIVDMCDCLLIQGGYKWYNYYEFIIKYAMKKDIPILGICMGMQLLACIDNNSLDEKTLRLIDSKLEHKKKNIKYIHNVEIKNDTLLFSIINKTTLDVNSNHRYEVIKTNDFIISAISQDGVIEAIENPNKRFVLGVQWHPEKMVDYDLSANEIFKSFINN